MDWAGVWLLEQRLVRREPGRRRGAERRWPPSPRPPRRSHGGRRPGGRVRPSEVVARDRVGRPGRRRDRLAPWPGRRVEIVLVHRLGYDDWSLPKGKLHPGETEAQAALREVQEETGLRCRLGVRSGPPPTVILSDDAKPSATGR
jgi:8-oxo-dGTP pyrophosphatase MutT (NUDIX family)